MNSKIIVAILASALLTAGCSDTAGDEENAPQKVEDALTQSFSGTLSATGTSWSTHKFTVQSASTLDISLTWNDPAGDYNLYLYDSTGALVKYSNTATKKPEQVTFEAAPGDYTIGIKCKSGSGPYAVTLNVTPHVIDVNFSGSANATTSAWQTFSFPAEAGELIEATLDWVNTAANLNVYLYDPSGKVVAYENSATAKPSKASVTAALSGTWKVALKCASGSTDFSILVRRTPGATTPPPPPPPPPTGPRFPGDPGPGKMYMGAAMATQTASAFDPIDAQLGGPKFSASRLYFGSSIGWSTVDAHIAAGRMPVVSFKNESHALANIASGAEDAWIDSIGAQVKARAPVPFWMTFYHEPEDNHTTAESATEFRAASRHIVERWHQTGVNNFAYVADYFMTDWTFQSASGRDWRWWYPDWKGTTAAGSSKDSPNIADFYTGSSSLVNVIGFDIYNFWEIGMAETKWRTFKSHADMALSRVGLLGKPYAVGEWGTMAYQVNGVVDAAKTRTWIIEAYDYMVAHDFVGAMYWNNDFDSSAWDCRLETLDPGKVRFAAMGEVMKRTTTVKPVW